MRCYHRTSQGAAILRDGFRDSEGAYMTGRLWRGVWLSGSPLTISEGAEGDDWLIVEIPEPVLEPFEWIEEGKGYREFLVPARILNLYPAQGAVECSGCLAVLLPSDLAAHGCPPPAREWL